MGRGGGGGGVCGKPTCLVLGFRSISFSRSSLVEKLS